MLFYVEPKMGFLSNLGPIYFGVKYFLLGNEIIFWKIGCFLLFVCNPENGLKNISVMCLIGKITKNFILFIFFIYFHMIILTYI
jgi:hypothetical protein